MDSNHADHDIASAQLLSANIYALNYFNCFPSNDSWQQTHVSQA
jgi:hypothetical protein